MRDVVYLDCAAGAPLRPEARAAALGAMDAGGNASSVHAVGRRARALIEGARHAVASLVGAAEEDVVFTSGAAEANNWVLGAAAAMGFGRLYVSGLEHPSVVAAAEASGVEVRRTPVRPDGLVDLYWLEDQLNTAALPWGQTFLALTAASHETGVIQPLDRAGRLMASVGGWLHVDATAALGRIPVSWSLPGPGSLVASGHKIGGLAGCGALVLAHGARLPARTLGGGQERGLRAGTENLCGVAAFGAAAEAAARDLRRPGAGAGARALDVLSGEGVVIVGGGAPRLSSFACIATPGFPAATQVMALDLEGVMVSAGAACSSGKVSVSPGLLAMGLGDLASCAIRISGGWSTPEDDYARFLGSWRTVRTRFEGRRQHAREVA